MSLKVLVVETDAQFIQQARRYLEAYGHFMVLETGMDAAIEHARSWQPDLVIASVELTGCQDGTLGEALRDMDNPPALLLTAHMDRFGLAWRAWQQGGDELLVKPLVHASELHHAVVAARQNALVPQRDVPVMAEPIRLSA